MISNIVISCLNPDIKTKTALLLSDKLDMLHADIDELIKYDVINPQDVIEKVGLDYFNKLVDKQVYNVSSYENTVITASDEIITNSRHISTLKTSALFIYLRISYKEGKIISKKNITATIEIPKSMNLNIVLISFPFNR